MIRKHIDLIAIGILLWGIAVYSHARSVAAVELTPTKRIIISHYRSPRVFIPRIPRIPYTRD